MPRGRTPRPPARTGRQDKVRSGSKDGRVGTGAFVRPAGGRALLQRGKKAATTATASLPASVPAVPIVGKIKGYNPIAPERIADILKRLNQLYPDVTCALTHKSAWELVVATILSAQSTDVNVNRVTPELFRKYPTVEAFGINRSRWWVRPRKSWPTSEARCPATWTSC
jgi:endonuclease-3